MALSFVLGSSGSGKTYRLYQDLINKSLNNPEKNYIVIVPEQFTMETQSKIVAMHPNKGTFSIDIVSFERLCFKVFEELGITMNEILDDTGKSLMIRKILEEKKDEFYVIKNNIDKKGFVEEVKSTITEMIQYGVNDEMLNDTIQKVGENDSLKGKLHDIVLVYQSFMEHIKGRYVASEETLGILCNVAEKSKILKNSVVTLDGYTGFTPIQYRVIRKLLTICQDVIVTVSIDSREKINVFDGMTNLFYLSKETIKKLSDLAYEEQIAVNKPIVIDDGTPYRLRNSKELTFLEKNLFRFGNEQYTEAVNDIVVYEGRMPKNEILFATSEIKRLVTQFGYHYRDFAIVTGDIEGYGELSANILSQNDIPCFLDYKRNILGNPVVNYLRGAMQVISDNYSYESVFGFLKSSYCDLPKEKVDILENYCLAFGVRGHKRYSEDFRKITNIMKKQGIELDLINGIRKEFFEMLTDFYDGVKKAKTVKEYCEVIYSFMINSKLYEKSQNSSLEFRKEGDEQRYKEYSQVFKKIIDLLDSCVSLLGEEKILFSQFVEILDAGFAEIKIGLIPLANDVVIIGDLERTRIENKKIVFILGVNDGIIPKDSGASGLISEIDKEILRLNNIEMSMSAREKVFMQRFYLYMALTKPENKLYLSYAKLGSDGKTKNASYLIGTVRKLFSKLTIKSDDNFDEDVYLIKVPKSDICWKFVEEKLENDVSEKLFGDEYMTSISAMEKYYSCEFSHFVTYGLDLKEREMYDVNSSKMGTLFHDVLETFSKKMYEKGFSFTDLDDNLRDALVEESVSEVVDNEEESVLHSTKRNEYIIKRVRDMVNRTVWAVGKQLQCGKFIPETFEQPFSLMGKLKGRIDRIDTCQDEDNIYIKVVDYKTGHSDFDLNSTYYGLKIQLITYMTAAIEMEKKKHPGKNIIPAAMLYYNIDDPFVDDSSDTQMAVLKELTMKGVVNSDESVVNKLDDTGNTKSYAVPISRDNEGNVKLTKGVLDASKLSDLAVHVDNLINDAITNISEGSIKVNPYKMADNNGCEYCSFRMICGFDLKNPGCHYRTLRKKDDEEIFRLISGEEGE